MLQADRPAVLAYGPLRHSRCREEQCRGAVVVTRGFACRGMKFVNASCMVCTHMDDKKASTHDLQNYIYDDGSGPASKGCSLGEELQSLGAANWDTCIIKATCGMCICQETCTSMNNYIQQMAACDAKARLGRWAHGVPLVL